jgi:hypothetical protein
MENISELLDEVFNNDEPEQKQESMSAEELRSAYSQAERIKGSWKGLECLGTIFEPFHDITIFRDEAGKFWYDSYYIGD